MPGSAFRPANDLIVQYAVYHRDRRNIATHFLAIPLVVLGVGAFLARFGVAGLSLAWLGWALTTLWYLTRGNLVLGVAASTLNGALIALAHPLALGSRSAWLGWTLGSLALGWLIQFLGHCYEGRRRAFLDDMVNLLVGPMFVVAEWLFAAGWGRELMAEIERRAGPTHLRDLAAPMAH